MKITATSIKSDLEPSTLQSTLLTQGNKSVSVKIKGESYGIVEVGVHEGDAILMAEKGQKGVKSNWLAKELQGIQADKIFIEYGSGKMIPALDVKKNVILANTAVQQKISLLEKGLSKIAQMVTGKDLWEPTVSFFNPAGETKKSFFDPKHPSFNGMPTLVGASGMGDKHHGYLAYDAKNDVLQLGVLNSKLEPVSEFVEDSKLRHLDYMIKSSSKYRIDFDDDALEDFREYVGKNTERRASQTSSKPVYAINQDKSTGITSLFVGDYKSNQVKLITSAGLASEGEIEINWGGDRRASDDYEYVNIADCQEKLKGLLGIDLNLDDSNCKKIYSMYNQEQ